MKTKKNLHPADSIDIDRLRIFMKYSTRRKLKHLEQLITFYHRATPTKSKKIWEKLKQQGF